MSYFTSVERLVGQAGSAPTPPTTQKPKAPSSGARANYLLSGALQCYQYVRDRLFGPALPGHRVERQEENSTLSRMFARICCSSRR